MEEDIDYWRRKINKLDETIVNMLTLRATYAKKIGEIKKKEGLPIFDSSREQKVIDHAVECNTGMLSDQCIQQVFAEIINGCKSIE
jgi:chorismate mutase